MKREVSRPRRPRSRDWPNHAVIWAVLAVELFPLYMMLQVSLKDNAAFLEDPWLPTAPSAWRWDNWLFGLKLVGPYLLNTTIVAVIGTAASLVFAVIGAYFFARRRLPFAGLLWSGFLLLMLLPGIANLVPLFILLRDINLLNTLLALIVVGVAGGQVFNIYVLRQFIAELPRDLFEAAEIDGAGHLRQIVNIVVPLSRPIIGTLAILGFLGKWNDFLLPFIVLRDPEKYTLGVGLIYLDSAYLKEWGQVMAAYLMASMPLIVVFLFCTRLFVRGLSAGAIKG